MLRDWAWCIADAKHGDFKATDDVELFVGNSDARSSGAVIAYLTAAQHVPSEAARLKAAVNALTKPAGVREWTFSDPIRAGALRRASAAPYLSYACAATVGSAALACDETSCCMDAVLAGLNAVPAAWCSLSLLSRMSRLKVGGCVCVCGGGGGVLAVL